MAKEQQLQWFPGHMMKAIRAIEAKLPIIDVIVEIVDARAPLSSCGTFFSAIVKNKLRILVLNKVDLADPEVTKQWFTFFQQQGIPVILAKSLTSKLKPLLIDIINDKFKVKMANMRTKGIKNPHLKVLIIGLPNVGKSTIINNVLQRKVTKTADCPGVTRGQQWIKLNSTIDLLDSPGILPPKIHSENSQFILSLLKALPNKHLFLNEIANFALSFLMKNYPHNLEQHYGIVFDNNNITDLSLEQYFYHLAEKYQFKITNNEYNLARAMNLLIYDLQLGKLGLISFEKCDLELN